MKNQKEIPVKKGDIKGEREEERKKKREREREREERRGREKERKHARLFINAEIISS